jgi:hypothetical protein
VNTDPAGTLTHTQYVHSHVLKTTTLSSLFNIFAKKLSTSTNWSGGTCTSEIGSDERLIRGKYLLVVDRILTDLIQ